MKTFVLILILGISLSVLSAQDNEIDRLMMRAEQSIYSSPSCEALFLANYYYSNKLQNQTKGKIYLQGDKFRLEYGDIIAVYDGVTLKHYNPQDDSFTISEPSTEELLQMNPLYFLRSRGKGFNSSMLKPSDGKQSILYKPQKKGQLKHIEVSYQLSDALPIRVDIFSQDGIRLELKITDLTRNKAPLPNKYLSLNQTDYPQSELIDLR